MGSRVRIDVRQVVSEVSPLIFGQFIEHIGRAIYGGVYEPGSPLSDAEGYRMDVIEKIRELNAPVLRWPGGNFSSAYHWQDGVGPKEGRPRRIELAWESEESNHFGTHEFMGLCRRLGTEAYFGLNLGWGGPEEAVNWLEYCNGTRATSFAEQRRRNGAEKPFDVKYWGLGNEIYGTWQHGHCEPTEYAHKAAETAKMMKKLDGRAQFVFCGGNHVEWDYQVLNYLYRKGYAGLVDYLSLHRYDADMTYYGMMYRPMEFEEDIKGLKGVIAMIEKQFRPGRLPMIAVDEWNVWYRKTGDRATASKHFRKGEDLLEEFYNVRDALYFGSVLNMFIRHADRVKMANVAQTVNVIAPIIATPKGSYYQPTFFPLKYYRSMHQALALDVNVESETMALTRELERAEQERYAGECPDHWRTDPAVWPTRSYCAWPEGCFKQPLALVDAAATRSVDGRTVTISLVNRHREDAAAVEVDLFDFVLREGRQVTITGPDAMGYMVKAAGPGVSDVEYDPEACTAVEKQMGKVAGKFTVEVPGHAVVLMTLKA
jgi:alpha-N-arabinofuranosidase